MVRARDLILFAFAVAGCSEQPPARPKVVERPVPRLAAGAAVVDPDRVVARLDLLDPAAPWEVEAPGQAVALQPGAGPEELRRALQLRAERTQELTRVIRRAPIDFRDFDLVRFEVLWSGHGGAHLEAWRGGEVVAETPNLIVSPSEALQVVELPVGAVLRAAGACGGLGLRFDGDRRSLQLRHVELVRRSPAELLPRPEGGPQLVALGTDHRLAWGVTTGRPLELVLQPGSPDAALRLAAGRPDALVRPGRDDALSIVLQAADGTRRTERVSFSEEARQGPRWVERRLPLEGLRGPLSVRFEYVPEEGAAAPPGGCALAELQLERPGPVRPSVLLVTSDTHRGDCVGYVMDDPARLLTPKIDLLASRGEAWLDAFSPANVTNPAHMALLTGESPRDLGVFDNATPIGPGAATLAEAFAREGYLTWAVVSTAHLGPEGSGLGQGFDRVDAPLHHPRPAAETVAIAGSWLMEGGRIAPTAWGVEGRPVFLWVHVFDAHWPYEPAPEWDRRFYPRGRDPDDPALPPTGLPEGVLPPDMSRLRDLDFPRAQYRAEIGALDEALGPLFREDPFQAGVTAFTADHGESLGEHGIWFNHDGLYRETLGVPLVIAWPGAAKGERHPEPVSTLDLGRTLLDLAGLRGEGFPGRALRLRQADRGPGAEGGVGSGAIPPAPRFAIAAQGLSASVTFDGWHLVLHLASYRAPRMERAVVKHATELYALDADPGCLSDLVELEPERARELRAQLVAWLADAHDLGWAAGPRADAATAAALAQLGYVGGEAGSAGRPAHALWEPDDCAWCRRFR